MVDVTRGQRDGEFVSYPPVAGATVTVTSRFNQREARGVTGADGIANIDIRELAAREKGQDPNDLEDYHFNGKVSVVADGYRTFETALMYVEGGGGLQVPAHPADSSGVPYPHLVTFDLWDALYSQNEFLVTTANADAHTITVEVADVVAGESMTISLWVDGEDKARKSSMAIYQRDVVLGYKGGTLVRGTLAHANLTGYFLKKGHADALPEGASLMIAMSYQGKTYSWPLAVNLVKGVVEEPAGKENVKLSPINAAATSGTALDLVWPKDIPLVGGGDLKFWTPQLPVNIYVNPFGYAQVTLKSPSWGYRKDSDNPDAGGWGKYPRKSVEQQWQSKVKTFNAMSDKTNALVSKPGTIQQIDLFKSFSVLFNFQLLALAKWDSAKGFFEGGVQGQITATLNFTLTESFFAGPHPRPHHLRGEREPRLRAGGRGLHHQAERGRVGARRPARHQPLDLGLHQHRALHHAERDAVAVGGRRHPRRCLDLGEGRHHALALPGHPLRHPARLPPGRPLHGRLVGQDHPRDQSALRPRARPSSPTSVAAPGTKRPSGTPDV